MLVFSSNKENSAPFIREVTTDFFGKLSDGNLYTLSPVLSNYQGLHWILPNITNMNRMFHWCNNLTEESIHTMDNWNISNVTDFTSVFGECITHPNWNGTWDDNGTFAPA